MPLITTSMGIKAIETSRCFGTDKTASLRYAGTTECSKPTRCGGTKTLTMRCHIAIAMVVSFLYVALPLKSGVLKEKSCFSLRFRICLNSLNLLS